MNGEYEDKLSMDRKNELSFYSNDPIIARPRQFVSQRNNLSGDGSIQETIGTSNNQSIKPFISSLLNTIYEGFPQLVKVTTETSPETFLAGIVNAWRVECNSVVMKMVCKHKFHLHGKNRSRNGVIHLQSRGI